MDDRSSWLISLGSRPKGEPSLLAGYPCKNLKTHNHLSDDCEHCVRFLSFSAESLAKAKPLREEKEKYNAWRRTGVMRLEIKILLLTREQFSSALLPPEQQSLRFSTWQAKFLSVFFRSIFLTEPLHALGSCHLYHPCRSANMNLLWGSPIQRPDCFMFAGYMSLVQLILVDLSYGVLSCKNAAVSVSDRLNSRHLEI